ncbi:MAG: TolC family protein [Campylobacterota bacterium]|nr:TolC family protein [Campylobacterota bacterium]
MIKKILLSFVSVLTLLQAQTLQESVAIVLETNPIILERLANYKETSRDLSIARSEYLPTLDLVSSIGHEKTDKKNSNILADDTSLSYYENSLTFMLNIFNGFGTTAKVDYQKSRIVAAAYNFIEKANDSAFKMTRSYVEIVKQRELLFTAKENVAINEEIFSKVNDLYSTGLTTKSEVRKIESSLFLARSNLVVQENNTMDSIFNFKKIYGERITLNSL